MSDEDSNFHIQREDRELPVYFDDLLNMLTVHSYVEIQSREISTGRVWPSPGKGTQRFQGFQGLPRGSLSESKGRCFPAIETGPHAEISPLG